MPEAPPRPLQRVHFFAGQLLTAEDLRAEQEYVLERLRRHNRWLHGWGVVAGLELAVDDERVVVEAGLALDCRGNEIVVEDRTTLALPSDGPTWYLLLSGTESPTSPVPVLDPGDTGGTGVVCSRIVEGWSLAWAAEDPGQGHLQREGRWQTCGEAHGIALGRLRRTRQRWRRLDPRYRVRRAK